MTRALSTPRLRLTPLDPAADADDLHAVWADPAVASPMGEGLATSSVDETRGLLVGLVGPGRFQWALRRIRDDATVGPAVGVIGSFAPATGGVMGLSWRLRRADWGQGLTSEAAAVVVDELLAEPGIDAVEAWIEATNTRSLGVARHARLIDRGFLTRRREPGDEGSGYQVVLGRRRAETTPAVLSVVPSLVVRDPDAVARLLEAVLGLHRHFVVGDPPELVRLGADIWSAGPAIDLWRAEAGSVPGRQGVTVETADVDAAHARALAAGAVVDGPPTLKPWFRREFVLVVDGGVRLTIGGAG